MLDATGKKLLRLLQPDQPAELRCATALVLGEVGTRDTELTQALCEALDDADTSVRLQAMTAAGKLHLEQALRHLLQRVEEGGPEGETAALAAARVGVKGTRALHDLMTRVAPGLRRRIAAALAAAGTSSAESLAVDALLDKDPGVVDATARSLLSEVPSLSESHRRQLATHLLELLGNKKKPQLAAASQSAVIRLLAALGDPRAEAICWNHTEPPYPTEVRAAALQALGKWVHNPAKDKLKRLIACAADTDFRVAAPALMILQTVPISARVLPDWLALLDAPDPAVRRAALEKVGDQDSPQVAAALVKQLGHRDRALHEEALARLSRLAQGRKALANALLAAESADEAWMLARAQAPLAGDYAPEQRKRIFTQACGFLEAGDRRADALLHVLREVDPRGLRDQIEERALARRKKKDYTKALTYLRLLTRDPACSAAIRFEQAACVLKLSAHDLSAEARAADSCLEQFANLIHRYDDELPGFVKQAKWLDPEDLFYLGFHFAEKDHQEQQFGGLALGELIRRSPQSKLAKDARTKLRREGLA
jgi:HEAT repeat protein